VLKFRRIAAASLLLLAVSLPAVASPAGRGDDDPFIKRVFTRILHFVAHPFDELEPTVPKP
jgi:hypothetical protein